jgi:hypothetical protein
MPKDCPGCGRPQPIRLTERARNLLTYLALCLTGASLGFVLTLCYQLGTQR